MYELRCGSSCHRHWSSNGLTTTEDADRNIIRCMSTHLTSFAVLVDVNGPGNFVSSWVNIKSMH